MTRPKKPYSETYRAQRLKYYRNRIAEMREEPDYETALALFKFGHVDDLDLIKEAEGEVEAT